MLRLFSLLVLTAVVLTAAEPRPYPLELPRIPVNGTDALTDPVALTVAHGFTTRTGSKIAEGGDELAMLDDWEVVETPHTNWAAPYANGPIRVLALTIEARNVRDAIELRQRTDFDWTIMVIPGIINNAPPASQPVVHDYFRERLGRIMARDYDVIWLDNRFWEQDYKDFPDIEDMLLEAVETKVNAGTGLVLIQNSGRWYRTPEHRLELLDRLSPLTNGHQGVRAVPERTAAGSPLTSAFGFARWPAIDAGRTTKTDDGVEPLLALDGTPILAAHTVGDGRVVAFGYRAWNSIIPDVEEADADRLDDWYEMVYATQVKALAWAAAKPPQSTLTVPRLTSCESGQAPRVNLQVQAPEAGYSLRWRLQDPWGYQIAEGEQAAANGQVTPDLPVCRLNGMHRLDLWLEKDGKIDNWGYTAIDVTGGPTLVAEPLFDLVEPGQTARFRVTPGVAGTLDILVADELQRISVETSVGIAGATDIPVDLHRVLVPRNRIVFTLRDNAGTAIARTAMPLNVPWIGLDAMGEDFLVLTYGEPRYDRHVAALGGLLYWRAGFNGVYGNWHRRSYIRFHFDKGVYSVTGAMSPYVKQANLDPVLKSSPNRPETREEWSSNVTQAIDDIRTYGGVGRTLDDEAFFAFTTYRDGEMTGNQADQYEGTIALMREHFQQKYGNVGALNESWGTDFAAWEDVRLIEENEVDTLANPSGWVECRQYMNWTYANKYYGFVQDLHTPLGDDYGSGPGAPGWNSKEGGPTYRGGDLSEMKKVLQFMMAYGANESAWYEDAFVGQPGGQKYDPPLYWQQFGSWKNLLNGADALWYYYGSALIGGELAWRRRTEWAAEGIRDVAEGCGTLVSRAEPLNRQVCILYSPENYAMAWLFGKRADAWRGLGLVDGQTRTEATMRDLLDQLLYIQPRYVTADDIVAGALEDCRLLVLSQAVNLGDETAAAIREYVRGGGYVVADIMPATRNRWGKPRERSALADVFGVNAARAELHKEAETWYSVGVKFFMDDMTWPGESTWLLADTWFLGVKPTTARPQGKALSKQGKEAPILFTNQFGEGGALLMNFVYTELDTETAGWHRAFGDGLREWAGLEAPARIMDPRTGAPLAFRPLRAFRRGEATLLGSIRGYSIWSGGRPILIDPSRALDMDDTARFTWNGERHVYNVREGKYLGFGEAADIDLPSFHGRLLALLPYRVTSLDLHSAPTPAGVRVNTTLHTDGGAPRDHVLRLNVVSPAGVPKPMYAATQTIAGRDGQFVIPFALNERPGNWRITVRDVMTGVTGTIDVGLE